MADIGLGPNLQTPDAAAPASGALSGDKGRLRVFISYSRQDLDFADQLEAALTTCGFDCVFDRHDISAGEDWKGRLGALIGGSDTVVFVLSPASSSSTVCAWEVDESARLGKRILPVVCRPLGGADAPARLQALNYVFFYPEPAAPRSGFGAGLKGLVEALNTDFEWLRDHTRYLERATYWNEGGRPTDRLLFGSDIAKAKDWETRRPRTAPELTQLQRDFVRASEEEAGRSASAERQRLEEMAKNYELRDQALHEAEAAVQKEREAQRKSARSVKIIEILAGVVLCAALATVYLYSQAKTYSYDASDLIHEVQYNMKSQQQARADDLFKRAVGLGNAAPLRYLGVAYRNGWGVEKNVKAALQYLEQSAAKGDAGAMDNLGSMYESGESGVSPDYGNARKNYEEAAKFGNLSAMNNLGRLYDAGRAVPSDATEALSWYTGFPPDAAKALYWYKTSVAARNASASDDAANGVEADAMFHIGEHYEAGRGVPEDADEARRWYESAAKEDYVDAILKLAALYEAGRGVPQDDAKALDLYEKAAQANDPKAMFRLGAFYEKGGRYIAPDTAEMLGWYQRAAAAGDAEAMFKLGALYDEGLFVAQDAAKARAWYEKAAGRGHASARELMQFLPIEYVVRGEK